MNDQANRRLRRPALAGWRTWTYEDYLAYFLSKDAVRARLRGEPSPASQLSAEEFREFCRPIHAQLTQRFCSEKPRISVLIPAFNEEIELLPSLVALILMAIASGVAELIIADNNSTDHTAAIIGNCGARYVLCTTKGVGHCRRAAYDAMAPGGEYVWLTDADTRVLPPLETLADLGRTSTVLHTCSAHLDEHPDLLGVSSGALPEGGHWLFRAVRRTSLALKKSRPFSCWAGYNQFVRRWALDEIGGIDPSIEFGDDHYRHYELARLGKRLGKGLSSANMNPALADPVYYSGRRYATLSLLLRHYAEVITRPKPQRDEHGYPIHEKQVAWRQIRLGPNG
jgi:glycosyltransferase involved in cell wall biosynthesis